MQFDDLIATLNQLNIQISLKNDDQLAINADKGVMTPELMAALKAHKTQLIALAKSQQAESTNIPKRQNPEKAILSSSQQRLWFVEQLAPGTATYHVPLAVRIHGQLDQHLLTQSIQQLINRHEAFRTSFVEDNGDPQQIIAPVIDFHLEEQACLFDADSDAAIELIQSLIEQPFDLTQAPLMRGTLLSFKQPHEYILLINCHHLITDGWSNQILLKELAYNYLCLDRGEEPNLPPINVQYPDYAEWQQAKTNLDASIEFWKTKLAGVETLNLPFDHPRPQAKSGQGALLSFHLPEHLFEPVRLFIHNTGCTPFSFYLAVFASFLEKMTQQSDIVIGTPHANRELAEIQQTVGFFVNTLALRLSVNPHQSLTQRVQQAHNLMLEASEHQAIPFETIFDALHIERDRSVTPVFQVMLAYQKVAPQANQEALNIEPIRIETHTAKFDLTLGVSESDTGVDFSFEYDTDLFEPATIKQFAEGFIHLLEQLTQSNDLPLSDFSVLPQALTDEIQCLARPSEWLSCANTLQQRWQMLVSAHSKKTAVSFDDKTLSYQDLDQWSNQIAQALMDHRAEPQQAIAICLKRSPEFIALILGCLKAGCFYIPIDPAYPHARQQHIVDSANPALLVTDNLIETKTSQLLSHDFFEKASHAPSSFTPIDGNLNDDVYWIYTSGSTGLPKGVPISQENLCRLIDDEANFHITPSSKVAHISNVAFDASVWEIFCALFNGATLVGFTKEQVLDAEAFSTRLKHEAITHGLITVALFNVIIDLEPTAFSDMTWLGIGGEAPNSDKVHRLIEHGKPTHFYNAYGPAENTVVSTLKELQIDDCQKAAIPLGKPVANTFCYVIDQNGHLCPYGVVGELALSSSGLSRGYHGLPEENAQAFIQNPFMGEQDPYGRLYRTGDMAVRLTNGDLVHKGRKDDQIKIRGFRIELDEITTAITTLPDVIDAVVVYEKNDDNPTLAAFVVPKTEAASDDLPSKIASELALSLPHYMIPSAFGIIDSIPVTPNGKVDKAKLVGAMTLNQGEYHAPETPMEQQVAKVFSECLQLDKVSRNADFFHLGGQSLLATRVIASLRQSTALDIQLRHLFDYPKVNLLARFLEELSETGQKVNATRIARPEKLPLSFAQQRLWFIEQMQPGSLYHMPFALKISGLLDTVALQAAFSTVILRHESLRTRFVVDTTDKTPYQQIDESPAFDLPILPFTGSESDLLNEVSDFIEAPFNLSKDSLIRAKLLHRQTDDQYFLLLCLHHIIADGWSIEILIRDLWISYQEILGNGLYNFSPPPMHYADFALLQAANTDTEKELTYWREHLDGCQPVNLPTDFHRPAILDNQGSEVRFPLPESLSRKIQAFCQDNNVSLFMLMHAALCVLLAKYSREDDISIGTPIANRSEYPVEDVIGLFLNTLVLRQKIHRTDDFTTLLESSKATALLAFEHQNTPFDQVIDQLNVPRDLSQTPVFNVMLIVQTAASLGNQKLLQGEISHQVMGDLKLSSIEGSERQQSAKFDLTFNVIDLEGNLEIALEYRTSLYKESTITRMGKHFSLLLDNLIEQPDLALSQQHFVLDEEVRFLLESGPNQTQVDYPKANGIHELFEQQVQKTPERIAVSDAQGSLTYQALDQAANLLAQVLTADAQPAIGLSLYRSRFMLVGILGILKAGKAYVPIDPELPEERVRFILHDAGIRTLVTAGDALNTDSLSLVYSELVEGCQVIQIDKIDASITTSKPNVSITDQDLVNILFTSGSTGQPKGVMVPHKGIINRLQWMQDKYPLTPQDKVLQKTPFTFDVSVWEFLWPVMAGAELVFAKKDGHKDPTYLADIIESQGITTLHFVPSMLRAFLSQKTLPKLPSIKQVFTSGEALTPDMASDWLTHFPHTQLDNLYGPTEASIDVSFYPVRDKNAKEIPIGKPIANTQLLILDEALNLCPIGVPGEIHIGGANLAKGYLNRDDLTEKAFIENPFPAIPSTKLYKTGDLGLMQDDGNIRYLGRNDFQVKLRGQRIELGEIEAQINQLEGIHQSVVIVSNLDNTDGLVAYYSGEVQDAANCHKALSEHLPAYMLPNIYQQVEALPLNPNGKVDRNALPPLTLKQDTTPSENPATTAIEKQLAELFGKVLHISEPLSQLSKTDNFFLIGGHSLRAIQLVGLIDEQIGITLPVTDIFVYPTIEQLAHHIEQQAENPTLDVPEIKKHPVRDTLIPASQNQQRLWRYQSTHKGSTAYHMPLAFWVEGDITAEKILSSLNVLADRHPILKTQLIEQDGELFQTIPDNIQLPFESHSVSTQDQALNLAQQALEQPFDLHKPCAFRAGFIKTETSHLLYLVMHHVISDARSLEILLGDWLHTLTANQEASLLPPIAFDYQDFSYWQNANQAALDTQLSFWQKHLDEANDQLAVLSRLTGQHAQTHSAGIITKQLNPTQVDAIQTFANWQSVTPFMLLLGALNLTLSKAGVQEQLTIGLPVSGRHRKGLNDIVGYFVNTLLFPVSINPAQNKSEYLQKIKSQVLATFANQDIALESILSSINHPTFMPKVGFNYFTQDQQLPDTLTLNGLTFKAVDMPPAESKYDLIFSVLATPKSMTLTVEYPANRYDANKVDALAESFIYLTEQLTHATDTPLADLSLYSIAHLLEAQPIDPQQTEKVLPLTPMQRDILLDSQLTPSNPRNYLGWILHIDEACEIASDALHQAVAACVKQNAALRMRTFANPKHFGDSAFQAILTPKVAIEQSPLIEVELEDDSDEALVTYCQDQVYSPYESNGPLFNIVWIKRQTATDAILIKGHHAAIDGLSLDIISRQLIDFYQAYQSDTLGHYEFSLERYDNGTDNYAEFVLSSQGYDRLEKQHKLAQTLGDCQPLSSPLGVSGQGFETITVDDTDAHFDAIKAWCKTHKTTPAIYLKALYGCLLSSYCQPDGDFFIDEVLASRPAGHANTLGAYFSTLPVLFNETHLREGHIGDVLKALRDQQKALRDCQGMSHSVQQQMIPQGAVQFLYNFYTLPSSIPLNGSECALTFVPPVMDNAVNLTLQVVDQHLRFHFTYDNAQFSGNDFILRLLSLSQQVLSGTTEFKHLSILLPEESVKLPTPIELPFSTVIAAVNPALQSFRNQIAVIDAQGQYTYNDLDLSSNLIANALTNEGVTPDDRIGLHLDANFTYLASLLGVLKTGATYVAIDTKYPAERKRFIGDDANLRFVLTEPNHAFDQPTRNPVDLLAHGDSTAVTLPEISPEHPLYVIYTSGSTGLPKGASVTQANFLNLLLWYQDTFAIDATQKVLIISSVGFDLTQKNLFAPLLGGSTIVFQDQSVYDPNAIIDSIDKEQITFINAAPSACYLWLENAENVEKLQSLKWLLLGGEAIQSPLLNPWFTNPYNQAAIVNMYGPSECTDIALSHRVNAGQALPDNLPLGRASQGVATYLLDRANRILPQGFSGELAIAGAGVGLGYIGHAKTQNSAFISHPQVGKLYRTGDFVLDKGELTFIGRKDHQLKIRGQRIEAAEITYQLHRLNGVKDSVVMLNDKEQLVAYLLVTSTESPIENLRDLLQDKLPDAFIPVAYQYLEHFPLSSNGKVDRSQLPPIVISKTLIAPKTATEKALLELWQGVFHDAEISTDDSFFALGGHSLLAATLVNQIQQQLGKSITLAAFLHHQTIQQLAQMIDAADSANQWQLSPIDRHTDRNKGYPLSLGQERLWLLEQIQGRTSMYNMPLAFRLKGKINPLRIESAIKQVADKHQVLITRLTVNDGKALQIIDPSIPLLQVIEPSEVLSLEQQVFSLTQTPFNVNNDPLFKSLLLPINDDEAALIFVAHHLISDGPSMTLFTQDLARALINGKLEDKPPLQYIDFSSTQRAHLSKDTLESQSQYWKKQLGDVPLTQLPTDKPYPAKPNFIGGLHSFHIKPNTAQKLEAFAQSQEATLSMLLIGALQLLLARYSGQTDITLGTAVNHRPAPELAEMMGFFVNTQAIRNQLNLSAPFSEHLAAVKATQLDAFANQDLPFEQLLEQLDMPKSTGHSPVFQVFYNFQTHKDSQPSLELPEMSIQPFELSEHLLNMTAKFELSMHMLHLTQGDEVELSGAFEYRTQLFESETIAQLAENFSVLLDSLSDMPDCPMHALPILPSRSITQQSVKAQALTADSFYPKIWQDKRDTIAVKDDHEHLSYNALKKRVNHAASVLASRGLKQGDRVALMLEPSVDFIVNLLAVIQQGGCYIPIDSQLPEARIQTILQTAKCQWVIAKQIVPNIAPEACITALELKGDELQPEQTPELKRNDSLYMIFTSGSTGIPKGVEVLHQGENNLLSWYAESFDFTDTNSQCLILSSLGFDLTQKNFFAPLIKGGTLHLMNQGFDPV
ncbi:MAG: amino acid adenylation domain-containing protein, partial [Cellvibrionales bacterium]|nr:amino acid adenylation domain-containing protein [Cellvibrionales bacterium]